jgi:hypothetical protein
MEVRMARTKQLLIVGSLVVVLFPAASARAQVLHRIPKDGQWVEFEGQMDQSDGQRSRVRWRFSSVGQGTLDGKPAR